MDVLNEQKLHSVVIDPALDRLKTEIVPALVQGLTEVLQQADTDLSNLLERLDGWTLEISVRLSKPKG